MLAGDLNSQEVQTELPKCFPFPALETQWLVSLSYLLWPKVGDGCQSRFLPLPSASYLPSPTIIQSMPPPQWEEGSSPENMSGGGKTLEQDHRPGANPSQSSRVTHNSNFRHPLFLLMLPFLASSARGLEKQARILRGHVWADDCIKCCNCGI